MILEFLLKNKALIVIAIMAIILVAMNGYVIVLKSQKEALVAEKLALDIMLDESQANVVQLKDDIIFQNTAIEKLKKDADQWVKNHAKDVKKAQDAADTYKKQAADLLNLKAPQNLNKCDAAAALIRQELKDAH